MCDLNKLIKKIYDLKIETPISVENDSDYFEELEKIYNSIKVIAKEYKADFLSKDIKGIIETIKLYYSGDIDKAIKKLNIIIKDLSESRYVVSSINESEAFKDYRYLKSEKNNLDENFLNKKVDFYRARIGINEKFNKESMYHIPFNIREKVNTERFSIPGMPCLYLGKSIYTCWVELGKPSDSKLNVSRVHVIEDIKVFNLVVNIKKIKELSESTEQDAQKYNVCLEDILTKYLRVWLLSIASSFVIGQKERIFKSEYIISQLMMLCLKKNKINAIAYYSKKISEHSLFRNFAPLSVNIAILADDSTTFNVDNNCYSKIIKKLEVSSPVNKAEFQNITSKRKSLQGISDNIPSISSSMHIAKHILVGEDWIRYEDTRFAELEKFLGRDKTVK